MIKIAHLSDLHLGPDIIPRALMSRRTWKRPVDPKLLQGLQTRLRAENPSYVVISGDFVNKPKKACFEQAGQAVRDLIANSGLDISEQLLVIPGNHDVSFFPRKIEDDEKRLARFKVFLRVLFQEEGRKHRFIRVDEDNKLLFLGLDTTLRSLAPTADGEVGKGQREWADRKLKAHDVRLRRGGSTLDQFVKIAILHHHCVSIPGLAVKDERFMQLLDQGDVMKFFEEHGFDIVLHGHKHVPHVQPKLKSDASTLVIIGAGTATSPYPDQQGTFGNTFNVISILPNNQQVDIQRFKANGIGDFEPEWKAPMRIQLGSTSRFGFTTQYVRKIQRITPDGTVQVQIRRRGLNIEPDHKVAVLPLKMVTTTPAATIENFSASHFKGMSLKWLSSSDQVWDGELVFQPPLDSVSGPAVQIDHSYDIRKGVVMSLEDWQTRQMGDSRATEEYSGLTVANTIHTVEMEVFLPKDYVSSPKVEFWQNGMLVDINKFRDRYHFEYDQFGNSALFRMDEPPIGYSIRLAWTLMDRWPLG
jgi:3',5'-cyclic AMP phosphodiesterase CpdA